MKLHHIFSGIVALTFVACVGDLDVQPIDPSDFTSEAAYSTPESYKQGLAKLYGGFNLVGQKGPGESEIQVNNAGASELNRAFWSLQEMTTDAAFCAWSSDAWVREINLNTWTTAPNDGVAAVYYRTSLIATLVNEYLKQTADDKLSARGVDEALRADIQKYRAEARFIRAYAYWMALDIFGNPPFTTEKDAIGKEPPRRIERSELFKYIETELLDLLQTPDLAEPHMNPYPRVDKSAARALLTRLYLNAKVYTGTERWTETMKYAQETIADYKLSNNYALLFGVDNATHPEARKEIIFASAYDRNHTQSYGGTSFLMNAAYSYIDQDMRLANGVKGEWGGIRASTEFVEKTFSVSNIDWTTGTYTNNDGDKRLRVSFKGRKKEFGNDIFNFAEGVCIAKFTNLKSDGTPDQLSDFSSTDYPLIRAAEIYLAYSEAAVRSGINLPQGLIYFNDVRTRAGLSSLPSYTLEQLFTERSRELHWEGHRRTDLIRFDRYTSGSYLWPFKGGVKAGTALHSRYVLFPLVAQDVTANPNLIQNDGYNQ